MKRFYRGRVRSAGLVSFEVSVKETDLQVSAEKRLEKNAIDLILEARHQVESYISLHYDFLTTLKPYPADPYAPPLVREMIECSRKVGVGPMASVAGAIAQYVGKGLLRYSSQVIVENGGDIFLSIGRRATVCVFAAYSPLSEKIGILVSPENMPLGICSSSATVGHSFSMGGSDVGCILASSTAFADAAATALCNRMRGPEDLNSLGIWAEKTDGVLGALVILGNKLASWGRIEIVAL
ncbi:MAG: UPF0280 family protein [Deltaproteobacteria bacterium]|nr:UPF0280 family protein [Deltaproteobacteria bacterium]